MVLLCCSDGRQASDCGVHLEARERRRQAQNIGGAARAAARSLAVFTCQKIKLQFDTNGRRRSLPDPDPVARHHGTSSSTPQTEPPWSPDSVPCIELTLSNVAYQRPPEKTQRREISINHPLDL